MDNLNKHQLEKLEEVATATQTHLQLASKTIANVYPNREVSLVKTKIEEALMWLEKYQGNISFALAHKTCK